ncbi:ketopantoate reductase family protein [Nannocystis radixulma]|uniref:2-dehydropantoate 2-reductase n=1 Tax=Nannocystis radixulma TaxID=2995305 RepID=A0ABT5BAG0_9BACT|nr:ketopantoate reductase family protein [Nannocystis radixulma]MDC0671131.1 ketopantoate reductase family protein [Nannocystis radixulma]
MLTSHPRPIWIVGAGAVGLHLAARLADVTAVTLVARGSRARALVEDGFELTGAEQRRARVPVVEAEAEWTIPPEAIVLVAVKATQLAETLRTLAPRLTQVPVLGLCQNGLGVAALAAKLAPATAQVRVACWLGAGLVGPTTVRVAGVFQLELAADAEPARSHMSELQGLLTAGGYPVSCATSIAACEWRKSLWNLAVSGPCALLDAANGAILDVPELRALAQSLLGEARAVAAAEGVALADADLERVFTSTEKTRANHNAMLQDLRRGAATEIAFLNGAVARLAERHGLTAPTHATVARLVAAREALGRAS